MQRKIADAYREVSDDSPEVKVLAEALHYTALTEEGWGYGPVKDLAVELAVALRALGVRIEVPDA